MTATQDAFGGNVERRMTPRTLAALAALAVMAGGCDCSPPSMLDSGTIDSGSADAGEVRTCERPADCDDGQFCNGVERCLPGDSAANAQGCVPGDEPCAEGEVCSEADDLCELSDCTNPDADTDGHDSVACGGDDCDDSDGNRYPGNPEVCDDQGHDEDCDPTSVGAVDVDGDGFVSAACCNDELCGDDCSDLRREVHSSATETCNAIDDDCDGVVDGATAFCPTGMCIDRRCRAVNLEWVFGSDRQDRSLGLELDEAGNVYVGVDIVGGGADVDHDGSEEAPGRYLLSIEPSGGLRFLASIDAGIATGEMALAGSPGAPEIALASDTGIAFFSGSDGALTAEVPVVVASPWEEASVVDLAHVGGRLVAAVLLERGEGASSEYAIELRSFDASRTELARIEVGLSSNQFRDIAGSDGFLAVTAESAGGELGNGVSVPPGQFTAVLDADLVFQWATPTVSVIRVAVSEAGDVALAGTSGGTGEWAPPWTDEVYPTGVGSGLFGFGASIGVGGVHHWTLVQDGPSQDFFAGVSFDGRDNVLLSGQFSGEFDVHPRGRRGPAVGTCDAFFGLWGVENGIPVLAESLPGSFCEQVIEVRVDPFGALVLLGTFGSTITLPSGTTYETLASSQTDLFILRISDF